jgi:hypothetical protein
VRAKTIAFIVDYFQKNEAMTSLIWQTPQAVQKGRPTRPQPMKAPEA